MREVADNVNESSGYEYNKIIYGEENVVNWELAFFSSSKKRIYTCMDNSRPSLAISIEPIKRSFLEAKKRGVEIRYLTEITQQNSPICKKLMPIVDEIRHVDGLKGNFMVSEKEYLAPSSPYDNTKPASRLFYSNLKDIVEQHQYLFQVLWNNGTSAQERIKEIEEGIVPIRTKILKNQDEIIDEIKRKSNAANRLSICSGFGGMQMSYNLLFDSYEKLLGKYRKGEGEGMRWITSIDKESIALVKTFLQAGIRVRHIRNMPPLNFGISDKEVAITIEKMEGGKMNQSFLISNEPLYTIHFNSVFEELWKSGVDAIDRIKDIEQDVESANINIIQNPKESIKLVYQLINSAKEEVLVMLPTANTFRRQVRMGGIQILNKAVEEHNISARVLVPFDKKTLQYIKKEEELLSLFSDTNQQRQQAAPQIDIRTIDKSLETKITIVITDRKGVMIWELKDDTRDSSYDAAGIAIHSNSRSIVSSYVAIFESFWKQSELYRELTKAHEQLKIHNKMQKEFINIAAHELRTPVQPIIGLSDFLLFKKGDIRQYRQLIDAINRNAKRLKTLTENLLDLTKIESQLLQLKIEQFDLIYVISNAMADCRSQVSKGDIKIKIKLISKAKDIFVKADKARIYQVIMNLLSNAIKFSQQGGIIIIVVEKQGPSTNNNNQILVKVKDSGEGIDTQIFPTLFTKFAAKSQTRGTGLGLFICKGIIEAHGGRIWAENNNLINGEKGATFYFSLPVLSVQQHQRAS